MIFFLRLENRRFGISRMAQKVGTRWRIKRIAITTNREVMDQTSEPDSERAGRDANRPQIC